MALIQRHTTELSAHARAGHSIHDNIQSIGQVLHDITSLKRQDEDEKHYLHSLNDRLEDLLHSLHDLEVANRKLRDDLNSIITNWGAHGETRTRFLQELDQIIRRLGEHNRQKLVYHVQERISNEQTQIINRIVNVIEEILHMYRDKSQIVFDLINELEDEYRKILSRFDLSNTQVKSHDDDYQNELVKFHSYLSEWSQLAIDKQNLMHEIQSLKERYNLRLAYNQEEINEWHRLLNRISLESKNFYRDYLDTIKQKIQIDYEKMAKEEQMTMEIQLKTRVKEIEEKMQMGLPIDENDERRRREETRRFENHLDESTKENDRLQNDFRILSEEIRHKRRILQDLQIELRNKARKHIEQHARLEYDTDVIRTQYYTLKDELDKLAYTLRFSVEEELKVYEALLNSLHRKREEYPIINESQHRQVLTKTTTIHDTITNGENSTGFLRSQPDLFEMRKKIPVHTSIDDSIKYESTPLLRESAMATKTTTTLTKTSNQRNDNIIPVVRLNEVEKTGADWTHETVLSGIALSTRGESTERDRSIERIVIPTHIDVNNRYEMEQNLLDENQTTTTTKTRTTRRFGHSTIGEQARDINEVRQQQVITQTIPEIDEKFLQSKVHITRKYKGSILIKFVDVNGRFVEIENTSNQSRDLTGWYIERTFDDKRIVYTFPVFELGPQATVRIYGNYHRQASTSSNDLHLELVAPNFYDWGNGQQMRTELFNRDDVGKALFEQTIKE